MKISIAFLFICLLVPSLVSFSPKKREAPSGTVYVEPGKYIDQVPVNSYQYNEFVTSVKTLWSVKLSDSLKNIPKYNLANTDIGRMLLTGTSQWVDKELIKKAAISKELGIIGANPTYFYYTHQEFYQYPMVNVTMQQAKLYCRWKSDMLMLTYAFGSEDEKDRKKYFEEVNFRLPTADEWSKANFLNLKSMKARELTSTGVRTFPIIVTKKDKGKFVHYPFNVSEMTAEPYEAIGLSWKDTEEFITDLIQEYKGPQQWLGFRCLCEVN
ncbi:MAG: hypothetical protein ACJAZ3_001303 [Sphingobacteriales bacterium]|jgi:hypothetical protein